LLSAISSAKSSMSIFSSWLAAPYSLVMTYTGTSTRSTISVSLWPIPAVSTTIRSNPAHLSRLIVSASTALVARFCRRVASERMKICSLASEFIRMRSPSSAPPLLRRVGSIATTAMVRDGWKRTKRIRTSSVRLDLPAPPVPVMPMTGAGRATRPTALRRVSRRAGRFRVPLERGDRTRDLQVIARPHRSERVRCAGHAANALQHVVHHPVEAERPSVLGRIDALHAVGVQLFDLVRRDGAAATDDDADMTRAGLREHVDHVTEVLVVPALIGAAGDRVRVLLDRGAHDVGHASVVAEVYDLGTVRLEQAADHVDGGVVTIEKRCRAYKAQRLLLAGLESRLAHGPAL
jgi:hypothetical protein